MVTLFLLIHLILTLGSSTLLANIWEKTHDNTRCGRPRGG